MREEWKTVKFGEVAKDTLIGLVKNKRDQHSDNPYSYVKMHNITPDNRFDGTKIAFVDANDDEIKKYALVDGDFLFNTRNSHELVGKSCIYNASSKEPVLFNNNIMRVRFIQGTLSTFVAYSFMSKSVSDQLEIIKSGTTNVSAIYQKSLTNISLPRPPLPEQKCIVAIIDEAFEGIDKAVTNAEKNLANARELFESVSRSIFQCGVDWEKKTLFELLELGWITSHLDGNHGGDYPRKAEFVKHGVPYISANCIKNDAVDFSFSKFLTPERASALRKGVSQNRDVLFAHNATVGPVAMLYTDLDKIILSTSLTYYRCNTEFIVPEYLAHYMRSPVFKRQYELVMRQSTRNQVPITKQREFYHLIPPVEKQKEIAKQLDDLRSEAQYLESIYHQKLTALNELKQSILEKAFAGELTAEGAGTIKKEAVA